MSAPSPVREQRTWLGFLQGWLVTTLAVLLAATLIQDIRYDSLEGLLVASLLLGVVNAVLRPLLLILALPLVVASLGLFIIVINALLLRLVAWIVPPFHVDDFWTAIKGAILIGLSSLILDRLTGRQRARVTLTTRSSQRDKDDEDGPGGPVIDA